MQVDAHAGLLHDAILQWAIGLNLTLAEGGSPYDGMHISQNIINLTFSGWTLELVIVAYIIT